MTTSRRCLAAIGGIVFVLTAFSGCSSSGGTGDKKKDLETWNYNGKMPDSAKAQMQAAMSHAGSKAQEPHGGTGDTGQPPGQAQREAAMQAAKDKSQGSNAPN